MGILIHGCERLGIYEMGGAPRATIPFPNGRNYITQMLNKPPTTKISINGRSSAVYTYYAGFSEAFVENLLSDMKHSSSTTILDPWNGAGTTTAVCARMGIKSVGVDINPAMRVVASARAMPAIKSIAAASSLLSIIKSMNFPVHPASPFKFASLVANDVKEEVDEETFCFLCYILMSSCKIACRKVRSRNPTWHSIKLLNEFNIDALDFKGIVESRLLHSSSAKSLTFDNTHHAKPQIITANGVISPLSYRATNIITSPPYLTRIDYVMKTLPELLFLNYIEPIDIKSLRHEMLGTVLTSETSEGSREFRSNTAAEALQFIFGHESKASSTYYFRFFNNYFKDLSKMLSNVILSNPECASITIVTQGTYYKEFYIDLPKITRELIMEHGFSVIRQASFESKNSMTTLNRRAQASSLPPCAEHAETFERVV